MDDRGGSAYEQKRARKDEERARRMRARRAKKVMRAGVIAAASAIVLAGIVYVAATGGGADIPEEEIISRDGIHYHPELRIIIHGEEQDIPAGIGLGPVHNPVHTHDPDGVVHLEHTGLVTKDDTRLSEFFKVWGKTLTSECIFDYCNGPDGTVSMTVNGEENDAYGAYLMKDGDDIVIRYE